MILKPDILFVDPSVPDIPTILLGLRPEVEAILLDARRPAARQMAEALRSRSGLEAVHVMSHGAPGKVSFAAGEWSEATLERDAEDLVTIGVALREGGELRLWACETGRGVAGEGFVLALAEAVGAELAAATGLVGAEDKGGAWTLLARAAKDARPPLTEAAAAGYRAVLSVALTVARAGEQFNFFGRWAKGTKAGTYFVVINNNGALEILGKFIVPVDFPGNFAVSAALPAGRYTVGPNSRGPGTFAVYSGNWNPGHQSEGTGSLGELNSEISATLNVARADASGNLGLSGAIQ